MKKVRTAVGQSSPKYQLAQKTKGRFRMLPLLPEELITPDVVDLIIAAWTEDAPEGLKTAFDQLAKTVKETYVGTDSQDAQPARASPRRSGVSVA